MNMSACALFKEQKERAEPSDHGASVFVSTFPFEAKNIVGILEWSG